MMIKGNYVFIYVHFVIFKRLRNWEWITLYVIQNLFTRPTEWQETREGYSLKTEVFPKETQKLVDFKSLRLTLIELL